jgi:hypothetical protein
LKFTFKITGEGKSNRQAVQICEKRRKSKGIVRGLRDWACQFAKFPAATIADFPNLTDWDI